MHLSFLVTRAAILAVPAFWFSLDSSTGPVTINEM